MVSITPLTLHAGNPQKAFALVRMSRSAEGALMVAQFCRRNGDHGGAIEFLLLVRGLLSREHALDRR
jgi:WD repeat-containing protein 19